LKEKNEVSLSELEARAVGREKSKDEERSLKKQDPEPAPIRVVDLPVVVSKGGGHLVPKGDPSEELSARDVEILSTLMCGMSTAATANLVGVDPKTIYRLLDSGRVKRLTIAARRRLSALAPLAVEIIHSELVKGNTQIAGEVLRGLSIMRTSVNDPANKVKQRSIAEEIVDTGSGQRTTRRTVDEMMEDE
jgi:hypothetical protein